MIDWVALAKQSVSGKGVTPRNEIALVAVPVAVFCCCRWNGQRCCCSLPAARAHICTCAHVCVFACVTSTARVSTGPKCSKVCAMQCENFPRRTAKSKLCECVADADTPTGSHAGVVGSCRKGATIRGSESRCGCVVEEDCRCLYLQVVSDAQALHSDEATARLPKVCNSPATSLLPHPSPPINAVQTCRGRTST